MLQSKYLQAARRQGVKTVKETVKRLFKSTLQQSFNFVLGVNAAGDILPLMVAVRSTKESIKGSPRIKSLPMFSDIFFGDVAPICVIYHKHDLAKLHSIYKRHILTPSMKFSEGSLKQSEVNIVFFDGGGTGHNSEVASKTYVEECSISRMVNVKGHVNATANTQVMDRMQIFHRIKDPEFELTN